MIDIADMILCRLCGEPTHKGSFLCDKCCQDPYLKPLYEDNYKEWSIWLGDGDWAVAQLRKKPHVCCTLISSQKARGLIDTPQYRFVVDNYVTEKDGYKRYGMWGKLAAARAKEILEKYIASGAYYVNYGLCPKPKDVHSFGFRVTDGRGFFGDLIPKLGLARNPNTDIHSLMDENDDVVSQYNVTENNLGSQVLHEVKAVWDYFRRTGKILTVSLYTIGMIVILL